MTYVYLFGGALIGMVLICLLSVAGDRRNRRGGYQAGYHDGHTDGFSDGVRSIDEIG